MMNELTKEQNHKTYVEFFNGSQHEYACYCVHGFDPRNNCLKCCKYCGIPFSCYQTGEDEYEIECTECGYNVS